MQFVTVETSLRYLTELLTYELNDVQRAWCQRMVDSYKKYGTLSPKQISVICDIYCAVRSYECRE